MFFESLLLDGPDNPAPPGAEVRRLAAADGVPVRAAFWRPTMARPRGTVLILQGRAEFIEKYFEVAGELLARGFAVATFDWRGQGGSGRMVQDGRKGHVRHFDDFRHDLEAVRHALTDAGMPGPLYGLAHSMGGCVALIAASEGWLGLERLVASAPMVGLSIVRWPTVVGPLAKVLAALGLSSRMVPGGTSRSISTEPFPANRLCRDGRRYARNAAVATALGAGAIGSPTIGWLVAAYEAMARLAEADCASRITVPTLVIGAGDDPVCSTPDAERFARAVGSGAYLLIPGARHEVMMEGDEIRAAFWRAFDAFVPGTSEPSRDASSAAEQSESLVVEAGVA